MLLKTKGNQKELTEVREHREKIEKTEALQKSNKEMDMRIEVLRKVMEEEE